MTLYQITLDCLAVKTFPDEAEGQTLNKDRLMDGWKDGGTLERMGKKRVEPKNGWKFEWIDGQRLE